MDRSRMRTWISSGLIALVLLAIAAGAGAVPRHVREQTEASMVLTGTISIKPDGSVNGYRIDQQDKVPDYVLSSLAQWVPAWRFKPVLVDGKAVPARAKMTLRMLAEPAGDGNTNLSIAASSFGSGSDKVTDDIRSLKMTPPAYPPDLVQAGGQGTAYILVKVGRDGTVEDAFVERVNLSVYASKAQMRRFRMKLGQAALGAARRWTFTPPTTGPLAEESAWVARVPVNFEIGRRAAVAYGQWRAYLPGPYQRAPWLDTDDVGSDALADDAIHTVGSGLVLLTPLRG